MSGYKFEIVQAKTSGFPPIRVVRREEDLVFGIFGPKVYERNLRNMNEEYLDFERNSTLTFRPATTAEIVNFIAGDVKTIKKSILNLNGVQIGIVARTSQGLFVNVTGRETESELKLSLGRMYKSNGIYLSKEGNVAFAPFDSFRRGTQESKDFLEGGLARLLEQNAERAENMGIITSKFPDGVNVWGFDPADKGEVLHRVAGFVSYGLFGGGSLSVCGDYSWDVTPKFAFGVAKN